MKKFFTELLLNTLAIIIVLVIPIGIFAATFCGLMDYLEHHNPSMPFFNAIVGFGLSVGILYGIMETIGYWLELQKKKDKQ
jgi:hypothetical protein